MFRRFAPTLAPKSVYFKDPDSHRMFHGTTYDEVARQVRSYRAQNELPELPYLEAVIENFLCRQKENIGGCEPLPPLKRGFMETLRGGIAVITSMLFERFASQEVADKRAETCVACPLNSFYDKSDNFVNWCNDIAEQTVGERRSKYHEQLGVCTGCTCGLRFKVFYADPIKLPKKQLKVMQDANPNCWQVKECQM